MFHEVFRTLLERYGPQHWWPAETPFEVMVGAVLTQNTAWTNVERAIGNLKAHRALDPAVIVTTPHERMAEWLRPSGYFNVKAERLRSFCAWYRQRGGHDELAKLATATLRDELLAVKGIGPETADDILLYAFERPVFVIDAYTRRLFQRLGLVTGVEPYEELRALFEQALQISEAGQVTLFNEYHALIVRHAKEACRRTPACGGCALAQTCELKRSHGA